MSANMLQAAAGMTARIGNELLVTTAHTSQSPQTIINVGPGDPTCGMVASIALGARYDDSNLAVPADQHANIIARVRWGQGAGAAYVAEVDVRQGTHLTVVTGMLVQVDAFWETDLVASEPAAQFSVAVAASVAWGTRGGESNPPTRTFPNFELEGVQERIFRVPNFADTLQIFSTTEMFYGGVDIVQFLGGPLATDRLYASPAPGVFDDARMGDGIKIPGMARYVRILKNVASPVRNLTLMFGLKL